MKKHLFIFLLICSSTFAQRYDYKQECQDAINHLDNFWTWKFAQKDLTLITPKRTFYSKQYPVQTECGAYNKENAFYCPADNSISLSEDLFYKLSLQYQNNGLFYMILAHEYGHLVQYQLKDVGILSLDVELQADCLAGVFFNDLGKKNIVEHSDLVAIKSFFFDYSDNSGGWGQLTDPQAHGTGNARMNSFLTGYQYGSANKCMNNTIEKNTIGLINGLIDIFSKDK